MTAKLRYFTKERFGPKTLFVEDDTPVEKESLSSPSPSLGSGEKQLEDETLPLEQSIQNPDSGLLLFLSQLQEVVGPVPEPEVVRLHQKYFNQPNYLSLATNEYLDPGADRNVEPSADPLDPLVAQKAPSSPPDIDLRMAAFAEEARAQRMAALWSKYIGSLSVSAMATRPTLSPLPYLQHLQLKRLTPKSKSQTSIVRIFTVEDRPREVARLPQDITNMLSPLFDLDIAEFDCIVMMETPRRLLVGDSFYICIDCFLKNSAFFQADIEPESLPKKMKKSSYTAHFAQETSEEAHLRLKQYALARLFDRLNISPFEESENQETIEDPQDSLNLDQLKQFYSSNHLLEYMDSLPESNPPEENFSLTLREYQKLGLSWMLAREKEYATLESLAESLFSSQAKAIEEGTMNPLWKTFTWPKDESYRAQKTGETENSQVPAQFYANLHNGELSLDKPILKSAVRGGILADEMGLGKTISTLALINSVPGENASGEKRYASRTTLVVVPMSLLSQWRHEFDAANNNPNHRCSVYYGDLLDLGSLTSKNPPIVVVTTYGTIQNEYHRLSKLRDEFGNLPQTGIYSVKFFRIVLDEGHTIRNRATKTAKAIHELKLSRKWVLTGTPVINRLDDIYSLIKFLQLDPWDKFSYWKTFITLPFEQKRFSETLDVVKSVLDPILLRRTKNMKLKDGQPLVDLPPKEVVVESIKFTDREQHIYDYFKSRANQSFKEGIRTGDLLRKYTQILTHILRLRQICCHPDLVGTMSDLEEVESSEKPDLESLQVMQQTENSEKFDSESTMRSVLYKLYPWVKFDTECMICTTSPIGFGEMTFTECGHAFCFKCILEHIDFQKENSKDPFCPACRGSISKYRLFKLRKKATASKKIRFHTKEDGDANDAYPFNIFWYDPDKSSSKIEALLKHLQMIRDQTPGDQVVVFSQFSSYLDIIQNELSLSDDYIVYKFDGRLNMKEREQLLENFKKHSLEPTDKLVILLLSLKAGGVGLNLTSANRAFMMDPWWSPSVEDQAIDRIHRIGQLQSVKVTRFVVENTIENKMLKVQERKRKMGEAVEVEEEERRKRRIEEIQILFED